MLLVQHRLVAEGTGKGKKCGLRSGEDLRPLFVGLLP